MQKQRFVMLVIGIVLAVIAIFMVKSYLDQQRQTMEQDLKKKLAATRQAAAQTAQAQVLVARKNLTKGSLIEPDVLEIAVIPAQYLEPQAATSFDKIEGMIVFTDIPKGSQITLNKLIYPRQSGGLSDVTPPGKRAMTIFVDNAASLAGMIKPGDYVDVIAVLTMPTYTVAGKKEMETKVVPLFQNVQILAVGQETSALKTSTYRKGERQESSSFITLALSAQEANLIAFVQEQGKIRLILRSAADSRIELPPQANWDALFQYVRSKEEAIAPKVKESPRQEIEIYRGLSRESITLSK